MNKPFLLLAGDYYYPSFETGDWQGRYATYEEAESQINTTKDKDKDEEYFRIKDVIYDWYKIVDLRVGDE
jgi:hypothetical protein